jgi:hypothetical protein
MRSTEMLSRLALYTANRTDSKAAGQVINQRLCLRPTATAVPNAAAALSSRHTIPKRSARPQKLNRRGIQHNVSPDGSEVVRNTLREFIRLDSGTTLRNPVRLMPSAVWLARRLSGRALCPIPEPGPRPLNYSAKRMR